MVGLSFSMPELLLKIYLGEKTQTIREENPVRIEQMKRLGIQLFWKQRSKNGFRLYNTEYKEGFGLTFLKTSCNYIYKYTLLKKDYDDTEDYWSWHGVPSWDKDEIAVLDGFNDFKGLVDALESKYGNLHNKVFDLIRWNPEKGKFDKENLKIWVDTLGELDLEIIVPRMPPLWMSKFREI